MLDVESLSERSENRRKELNKEKKKFFKRFSVVLIVIIVIMTVVVIYRIWSTNTFHAYKTIKSVERTDASTSVYQEYNEKLLKYSKDGALGYDTALNKNWSGSYDFSSPIVDTCGEYVAIADSGGKEIYVFDGNDSPDQINVDHPISLVRVASQGVVAVMMEYEDSDMVQLYDSENSNKLLVEFSTNEDEDGYPIDLSISNDGSKLVTSYLTITNGVEASNLTFYNLGEVGKNYSNKIVGSEKYDKTIISKVAFLNNDTVCAFKEDGFVLYSMKQLMDKVKTETFETSVKSIFFNNGYFGFVCENAKDSDMLTVVLYNIKGKKIMSTDLDFAYTDVYMAGKQIFFLANQECQIMRINGKYKFKGTFDKQISYIMPINNFNKYLLVDKDQISIIKIVEG